MKDELSIDRRNGTSLFRPVDAEEQYRDQADGRDRGGDEEIVGDRRHERLVGEAPEDEGREGHGQGDEEAVVCALELAPTQLRIASGIAVSPKKQGKITPEVARMKDGNLLAEPWQELTGR